MSKAFAVISLLISAYATTGVDGSLGTCLREVFFGQDTNSEPYTPKEAFGMTREARLMLVVDRLHERDIEDDGLDMIIPAGGGIINIADLVGIGNGNTGSNLETQAPAITTTAAESTSASTTSKPASSSTKAPESSTTTTTTAAVVASETTSGDTDSQPAVLSSGTYSQEPSDTVYTCKSDFIDFSQRDAMSKFSLVWCPENAYQTDNSVVWRLTQECGMTMVYPWDFHYGKIEGRVRIGPGSGVVTAMILMGPPPSDEIDFEWVGKDVTHVQTMYYVQAHRVDVLPEVFGIDQQGNGDLSTTFQNYAIELNKDSVKWYLNGQLLRTLNKKTQEFPTYANRARMGIWDGTQTSGWAGTVDWSQGPFTAEMQWFNFTPYC
ncbi:concanavalin A-like lectin/glucanase domain-containing protein [Kickxella alabastrina]|uniref:concanavalin A-like lectin/glucanase domain-containing protein n=1 Tax=Kickxella alabastrina TaxID=61397 RepID=UPI00221F653E|nr:concanavalin A-like lectin/glucanase domain-containing protein [Kickxella alabastrina]KAI7821665.1 concanavalin A-like lectin/glucanase domain-containing protein [Kickxella alabastrina]